MSDLDMKLYAIIETDGLGKKIYPKFVYNRVEKIKQAFIDDGWIPKSEVEKWQKTVNALSELSVAMHKMPSKVYVALDEEQKPTKELVTREEWEQQAIKDG